MEDAIKLGLLDRKDIPKEITKVLGSKNSEIVNTIILDIVNNSYEKGKIIISKEIYTALNNLLEFNYKNVYGKANSEEQIKYYEDGMNKIYDKYLNDLESNNKKSIVYEIFLNYQSKEYLKNTNNKRIVIDFIAGMTDDFFVKEIESVNQK
jgi:dGTPase